MLFAPAAIAAPSPVRAELSLPFPAWQPSPEANRQFADRLAWGNDSADNDPFDGYPGEGWDDADPSDAGPACEPTDAELVAYLAGDTLPHAEWDARDTLLAIWDQEARDQAAIDDIFFELHSPYTPTYLGDPQVARLALASGVGHPA